MPLCSIGSFNLTKIFFFSWNQRQPKNGLDITSIRPLLLIEKKQSTRLLTTCVYDWTWLVLRPVWWHTRPTNTNGKHFNIFEFGRSYQVLFIFMKKQLTKGSYDLQVKFNYRSWGRILTIGARYNLFKGNSDVSRRGSVSAPSSSSSVVNCSCSGSSSPIVLVAENASCHVVIVFPGTQVRGRNSLPISGHRYTT